MKTLLLTSTAACSILFTSCGKKAETNTTPENENSVVAGPNKDNFEPEEAVKTWKDDATSGRVSSLWDSLPKSYQSDVEGLVHSSGGKVDAEVYNEALKTLSAAANLLESKKSIIIDLLKESAPPEDKEKLDAVVGSYDSIVGLLKAVVNSDAKTVDGLKALDIAKFCADIQPHTKSLVALADLANDAKVADIKAATVKLLSKTDDSAEVEVTVKEQQTQKLKLSKVGKRWVPTEVSKDWDKKMAEAKEEIGKMQEMSAVEKEKALSTMRIIQAAIKDLDSANTKEELQAKAQEAMGQVMGNLMGGQ